MNMATIWKQKINEIQAVIDTVSVNKDGRLKQLYRKKALLEQAMNRCIYE
jgi:hypothetical protein